MHIDAFGKDHQAINNLLRTADETAVISHCLGQRFIAAGMADKTITIEGVPGNALGAYLNGAHITVSGNAQDAVGDTMNDGEIVVSGSIGDAAGYAMRGGKIFVRQNAGYRAGIHMKAYKEKQPLLVIGGTAGSFLGEYQAGGTILVLGLDRGNAPIVGDYPSTGMHGGKIFLRCHPSEVSFPPQVTTRLATEEDMSGIALAISDFCRLFGEDAAALLSDDYTVVVPEGKNPYKQMYVAN